MKWLQKKEEENLATILGACKLENQSGCAEIEIDFSYIFC